MLAHAIREMFRDLDESLEEGAPNGLDLPWGYQLVSVSSETGSPLSHGAPPPERAEAEMRLPIVWEIQRGTTPVRASDRPSTDDPELLKALLESRIKAGRVEGNRCLRVDCWTLERPPDVLPSRDNALDAHWTMRMQVEAG